MPFEFPIRIYWEDTDTSVVTVWTAHLRVGGLWTIHHP